MNPHPTTALPRSAQSPRSPLAWSSGLNLWWLVLPGVLLAAGVLAYRQRRLMNLHGRGGPGAGFVASLALAVLSLTHLLNRRPLLPWPARACCCAVAS